MLLYARYGCIGCVGRAERLARLVRLRANTEQLSRSKDEYRWKADLLRRTGELQLRGGDVQVVGASFKQAVAVARVQNAKMWELQAAFGLARSRAARDRQREADDLLHSICGGFCEGSGSIDQREEKDVLDSLC